MVTPVHARPHQPIRPLWLCRACAAPWPCPVARLVLWREYAHDRAGLSVYLATMLHDAVADLYRLRPETVDPATLFARFIGWTRCGMGRSGPTFPQDLPGSGR